MSFHCDTATLERLEWPRLANCLAERAATRRGAEACRGELFCSTRAAVEDRLAETDEVRSLLDAGEAIPFGGVEDVRDVIDILAKGSAPGAPEFARLAATLEAAERIRRFLSARAEAAPRLADLSDTLPALRSLAASIWKVVTPEGEVRNDASAELARLTRRARELQGEIERRMGALLRVVELQPHLQDRYVTSREGRPVLPVRADARARVPGIVHDVSSSGTTVFIEPEAVVEFGNRLRVVQTRVQREIERLLRELAERTARETPAIGATAATLEVLDVAQARGRLSRALAACAPELDAAGTSFELLALQHPLLLLEAGLEPDQVVANDIGFPDQAHGLVISGPNAGGKTVAAKAVGLAALAIRAGLHVPCARGSRMPVFDAVCADIGDEQDLRSGLSTFSARMSNLAGVIARADSRTLVIVDEIGEGTEPGEGAALAQSILEGLVARGARVVATTHFNRLKELAAHDPRFCNASAEFDRKTLLPTYRIRLGAPGSSGATFVAERMGVERAVVERARELLDSEERKLEALTESLSALRQELEAEKRVALDMRRESEVARSAYERRLEQLRAAREQALATMKGELEAAIKSARAELAAVMRQVQGGGRAQGRAASRAYRRVSSIEERAKRAAARERENRPARPRVDWSGTAPGMRLELDGIGEAVLVSGPDRRDRITVRIGDVRSELPAERALRVLPGEPTKPTAPSRVEVERAPLEEVSTSECDLRGLRVDEALDRADAHLQALLGRGAVRVRFIHGHGTGALRSAIRSWLRDLPEVERFAPGGDQEGGNGVTIAELAH